MSGPSHNVSEITVVVSCYKRPRYLLEHLRAIENQSLQAKQILVWSTRTGTVVDAEFDAPEIQEALARYPVADNSRNFGVWGRFAYALLADTEFVCVIDDDQIPGSRWLEHCLDSYRENGPGVYGPIGHIFDPSRPGHRYSNRLGTFNPPATVTQVDVLGHSWFMHRDTLAAFWRERPRRIEHPRAGENIHLAHMAQKYLGLGSFVPSHPKDDPSRWGTDPALSAKYGRDAASIYQNEGHVHMDAYLHLALENGFRLLRSDRSFEVAFQSRLSSASDALTHDLRETIPSSDRIVLIGQPESVREIWPGCQSYPFLERDGKFWGKPGDSASAIEELERMRANGFRHVVFPRPTFWWFDKYRGFAEHLRSTCSIVAENDQFVVFSLEIDLSQQDRDVSS